MTDGANRGFGIAVSVVLESSLMLRFLKRYFQRRRLRPIVSALPRRLAKSFGAGDYCTSGQARRAISDLHLDKSLEPHAYAAACTFSEIERGGIAISADDYQRLRAKLMELFDIPRPNFTIADLLSTPYSKHHPAEENAYASSGPPTD
jgi:hypothetical protein